MKLFKNYGCLDYAAEVLEILSLKELDLIQQLNEFSCNISDEITDPVIIDKIEVIEGWVEDNPNILSRDSITFNVLVLSLMRTIPTDNFKEMVACVTYITANNLLIEWGTLSRCEELENMLADNSYCAEKGLSPTYRLKDLELEEI